MLYDSPKNPSPMNENRSQSWLELLERVYELAVTSPAVSEPMMGLSKLEYRAAHDLKILLITNYFTLAACEHRDAVDKGTLTKALEMVDSGTLNILVAVAAFIAKHTQESNASSG